MEGRKYKRRVLTEGRAQDGDPSLRKNYEKEKKEELVVQRSIVMRARDILAAAMRAAMTALALIGATSLARPELRMILLKIAAEAAREIRGF